MTRSSLKQRFIRHLYLLVMLVLLGTLGYMVIEQWNLLDAVFMTVTTLTTVGFGEVHPLTSCGRIYTIALILFGVGALLYILSDMAELIIETNPTAIFGRQKMKQKIARLSAHQIVCGYGRTGQEVALHFRQNKVPYLVVEADSLHAKRAEDDGHLVLQGDATLDEVLVEAKIGKAQGIVCALPDDAANTFIALTARGLNEKISIVCRAANPGAEGKMKRAGAQTVISPYVIGGRRMAIAVTHPLVLEFLDVAMHSPAYDLRLEQIAIVAASSLIGKSLKDANMKDISGAMVLAIQQKGTLITNSIPELVFHAGDALIALGTEEELGKLHKVCNAQIKLKEKV